MRAKCFYSVVVRQRRKCTTTRTKNLRFIVLFAICGPGWGVSHALANGGDTCAAATAIGALPFSDTGTTVGFTNDYDETCISSSGARDVVYSYTPASDERVTIALCPSAYDTFLYVYDTNCPGTVVDCNDDACGTGGLLSQLTGLALTGGTTYFFIVDGWSTSEGSFTIDVTLDFLSDHPVGQESNAFITTTSTTDDELFAFALDPGGASKTVTQVVFSLSDIVGLTDVDWSGIEIVEDSNDDGNIGVGETTTVGGAGAVNQAAGTITFSTSFNVTTKTSYILRADFASLSSGDAVTIDLLPANLTGGPGTGVATTASHALMDLSNGLLGFWKLNDNAGTSATDSSGNARTGTLTNGPTWTGGHFAGALNFDEINDHLLVTDFSYGPGFTWSFWFKTEDNSGSFLQYILSHGAFGVQNSLNVYLIEGTSVLRTVFLDGNDTLDTAVFDVFDSLVGTGWHLYTLTVAAGVGSKVFIDGVLKASDATRGGDAFNPTTNIFLAGREDLDSSRFYGGRIDDVRLYNRALSLVEVQRLAAGAGLKAHWKLDDGAGTTATDSSGSNNGTLTGVPTWVDGHLCGGLDFDGTNDYVDMGDVLDMGDTDDFTITGWFSRDTFANDHVLVAKRTVSDSSSAAGYVVFVRGSDDAILFRADDGVDLFTMTSSTTITVAGWNHFAVVWDQRLATDTKIYINGVDDSATQTGTMANMGSLSNADALRIGARSDVGAGGKFDGRIDDIRIYNRALSADEIQSLAARYQVINLGSATGDRSLGSRLNASEQVAGFDSNATSGNSTAWFSQYCVFTTVTTLTGGSVNEALGINAAGKVVGWSDATGSIRKAYMWTSGGGTTDLGLLAGRTDSEAFAINSSDEVVGTGLDFGVPPDNRLAFFYLPVAKYGLSLGMNSLGTLGGSQSIGRDVNDSGEVVGGAQDSSANMKPFMWLPSAAHGLSAGMNSLGTLGGDDGSPLHRAEAINATGEVVGHSFTAGGAGHAFHWSSGTMTDLGTLTGGDTSFALDINDSGIVVGTSNVTGGAYHAFVWDGTTMTDLNDVIDSNTGWTLTRATGINNDGEIVGWGTNNGSAVRAFMLIQTCAASTATVGFRSLAGGLDEIDINGDLEQIAVDRSGNVLAEIQVSDAAPGEEVSYVVMPAQNAEGAPGVGTGTFAGFEGERAFARTLTLESSAAPAEFFVTVRMAFSLDELIELGAEPADLQLHRLDPALGAWLPAGKNVGESPPSDVLGDSGFVESDDGGVDYWAITNEPGVFAVGETARANQPEEPVDRVVGAPSRRGATGICGMLGMQVLLVSFLVLAIVRIRRREYIP